MEAVVNPFDLLQTPLVLLVYALIILAVLKIVAPDGIHFDDMLQLPKERQLPRGVQEEEPLRWQVERLTPRFEAPETPAVESTLQPYAPARS